MTRDDFSWWIYTFPDYKVWGRWIADGGVQSSANNALGIMLTIAGVVVVVVVSAKPWIYIYIYYIHVYIISRVTCPFASMHDILPKFGSWVIYTGYCGRPPRNVSSDTTVLQDQRSRGNANLLFGFQSDLGISNRNEEWDSPVNFHQIVVSGVAIWSLSSWTENTQRMQSSLQVMGCNIWCLINPPQGKQLWGCVFSNWRDCLSSTVFSRATCCQVSL